MYALYDSNNKFVKVVNDYTPYTEAYGYTENIPKSDETLQFKTYNPDTDTWDLDEDAYTEWRINRYVFRTLYIADKLDDNAELAIVPELTQGQIDRYKFKYQRALANDVDFFEPEAQAAGISADDLLQIVLANGDNWTEEYKQYIKMIEATRWRTKEYFLAQDFDRGLKGLQFMKELKVEYTMDHYFAWVDGEVDEIGELPESDDDSSDDSSDDSTE